MFTVAARVTMNKLPTVEKRTPIAIAHRMERGALFIRLGAQRRSRFKTGRMFRGWQVAGSGNAWRVFNDVPYTVYNEYGTIHMSPQPMLRPAIDEMRARMRDLFAGLERDIT